MIYYTGMFHNGRFREARLAVYLILFTGVEGATPYLRIPAGRKSQSLKQFYNTSNSFLKNSFHGVFQGRFYKVNS